jgi:phosphoribosylglycinamide formyltransferase-1
MAEEFISEQILPVAGTFDPAAMAKGAPALPGRFCWRNTEYTVAEVIKTWKESGPDKGPTSQMYLRKHWFELRTTDGTIMTIYFERQPRSKHQAKKRWWLYSILVRDP